MSEGTQKLDFSENPYLTLVKKEINELNITDEYKNAIIECVEKLFDTNQLPTYINNDYYNRKILSAERDLVMTRLFSSENDVLSSPYQIENKILLIYSDYIKKSIHR